ncbi:hypothetical protein ACFO0M_23705 [Micromonospora mangrovi]|uniref:WD40 repeat protein n=2 Tax=Micromonospora TaxID=1873 RepID=A0AAU8HDM7_9ACTN
MTRSAEDALRAAVHDLAAGVRPAPDLAGAALRRGRRLRRRRRATAAGAALAAIVAVLLPFVLLRPDPVAPPATPPATATPEPTVLPTPGPDWTTKPLLLPGDRLVVGAAYPGGAGRAFVLDRGTGEYRRTSSFDGVYPAPTGSFVAVRDEKRPRQVGLADLRTGRFHWYEVGRALSDPQWSPDGRRLLLTTRRLDHEGFIVLETDGTTHTYPVDRRRWFCTDYCNFTWTRDGREVALPQTGGGDHNEAVRDERRGVQLFSADDGQPTRLVPVPGDPAGPDAWSPDGRLVVVQGQREPLLVETATGRVVNPLPAADVVWVSDDRLLYREPIGAGDYVLADPAGRELVRQPLPRELVAQHLTLSPR